MWIQSRKLLAAAAVGTSLAVVSACSGHRSVSNVDPTEQVAIGYDRIDPDDVTGSVASLTRSDLEQVRVSRVAELIRDRIPGVHVTRLPNGEYSFRIRGARSLMGNNEPLVVINGIAVSPHTTRTALAGIAPTDVVRIDVLKDAGSTAAYGSRGANGVIVITTRTFNGY